MTIEVNATDNRSQGAVGMRSPFFRRSALIAVGTILAMFGAGLGLFFLLLPDHVSVTLDEGRILRPDAGYTWTSPDDRFDWRVKWTPGIPSPMFPNVIAAVEPDKWRPAPGYTWTNAEASSREVIWVPGRREPEFPHVASGATPGIWNLDPGYAFTSLATPQAPHAVWRQGLRDLSRFPNMESAAREGYWILDPGYAFAVDSTVLNPKAVWTPGTPNWQHPHVLAGTQVGNWTLERGFLWLEPRDNNDLRTFSGARTVETWSSMLYIDFAAAGTQCSDTNALKNAIRMVRSSYGALDSKDVHPQLAAHIRDIYSTFDGAYTTLENCQAVDAGTGALELGIAAACLFADDWQECMEQSKLRGAGKLIGGVATGVCVNEGREFRVRVDELRGERRELHRFLLSQYNLQLSATELRMCN